MERRIEVSVVSSLAELRAIEHERIAEERAAVARVIEERVAAARAAEQRERDELAARERAERADQIRIAETHAAAERAAPERVLAVEGTERARQDAELARARLDGELDLRREAAARRRPFVVVSAIALACAIALGVFAANRASDASAAERDASAARDIADRADKDRVTALAGLDRARGDLAAFDARIAAAEQRLPDKMSAAEMERRQRELDADRRAGAEAQRRADEAAARRRQIERNKPINDTCMGVICRK